MCCQTAASSIRPPDLVSYPDDISQILVLKSTGVTDDPGTAVLMFIAHRDVEARVMATLTAAGITDVTLAQSRLLQRLNPVGTRLTDVAEQARVTKQTAGAL